jgi:hypothetical protein
MIAITTSNSISVNAERRRSYTPIMGQPSVCDVQQARHGRRGTTIDP